MPRTPDEFPGISMDEGICLYDQYGDLPDCYGGILYSDGYFYAKDNCGIFNLRCDGLIKISSGDNTANYLENKIIDDGYGVNIEVINDGGNEQLQISLSAASSCGQVFFAADGINFTAELPITSCGGWLLNDCGILLVRG